MDLTRTRVVLRERAVVDVLDLALRFTVRHGRPYARLGLLVLPPFVAASIAIARTAGPATAWALSLFVATLAGAPFTALASRLVFEDEVRIARSAREAFRAAPQLLALRVVEVLAGGLGLAFFTVPGLWFLALTLFDVEATLLERASLRRAIERSASIARRGSGEALVTLVLLFLLHVLVTLATDGGGRAIISALLEAHAPLALWDRGWSVLSLVGFWLFVPYAATARFFVYLDMRTRTEGWDIQTRFVAIATRALEEERVDDAPARAA
jgi:hypothetical protein